MTQNRNELAEQAPTLDRFRLVTEETSPDFIDWLIDNGYADWLEKYHAQFNQAVLTIVVTLTVLYLFLNK